MNEGVKKQNFPYGRDHVLMFAAAHLEHGHIYTQCDGLIRAGAVLKWVYEPDAGKRTAFLEKYPGVRTARSFDEILADPTIQIIAAAAVPSERAALGCRAMQAGKDYFTDKPGFTTLEQLVEARRTSAATGRKYWIYYSERFNSGGIAQAADMTRQGAIGRMVHFIGLGPHRLGNKASRPSWFWHRGQYGGILCDLGSHQFEQFIYFSGANDVTVTHAVVGNFGNHDQPELEDFGECSLVGDNGVSGLIRVDWLTPAGLSTWGDGRIMILGTSGFLELRKNVDIAREQTTDTLYLVDARGERCEHAGKHPGMPRYRELVMDCLDRSENFMTQFHVFKAAELSLKAQAMACRLNAAIG
jgi:predicted dehydrogenase